MLVYISLSITKFHQPIKSRISPNLDVTWTKLQVSNFRSLRNLSNFQLAPMVFCRSPKFFGSLDCTKASSMLHLEERKHKGSSFMVAHLLECSWGIEHLGELKRRHMASP